MKSTGIVRRIDDLGRVVIPKEIRRNMRIREGDALEIYTDKSGGICLRKYSPIGEIDVDMIKTICDKGLGTHNYTVYDMDGYPLLPTEAPELDVDAELDNNTCHITSNGECVGFIKSPSGNRSVVADILGGLLA